MNVECDGMSHVDYISCGRLQLTRVVVPEVYTCTIALTLSIDTCTAGLINH